MGDVSSILSSIASGSSANTGTSAATSAGGAPSLASNFTTFLTLLTTQLQHQDPSTPVDSNQFTQQLVSFAGVQQQVEANSYLKQLLAAVQSNQVGNAASYIGTTVQATGNQGALIGGTAQFGYDLVTAAGAVQVTIKNSGGQQVFSGTGTTSAGRNIVNWDGINSHTGAKEADGVYTISVKATDANNNAVQATPFIIGKVNSAQISNGEVMLDIGALQVPASNVTSITNLPGASA